MAGKYPEFKGQTQLVVIKNRFTYVPYSPDLAAEICDVIACSPKSIIELCNENQHWPDYQSIWTWMKKNPEFKETFYDAKRCQVDFLLDQAWTILNDNSQDYYVSDGQLKVNPTAVARAKMQIDYLKWLAGRLIPKVYGDKVQVNTTVTHEQTLKMLAEEE